MVPLLYELKAVVAESYGKGTFLV